MGRHRGDARGQRVHPVPVRECFFLKEMPIHMLNSIV